MLNHVNLMLLAHVSKNLSLRIMHLFSLWFNIRLKMINLFAFGRMFLVQGFFFPFCCFFLIIYLYSIHNAHVADLFLPAHMKRLAAFISVLPWTIVKLLICFSDAGTKNYKVLPPDIFVICMQASEDSSLLFHHYPEAWSSSLCYLGGF